jgi:hypothetical protein
MDEKLLQDISDRIKALDGKTLSKSGRWSWRSLRS